MPKKAYIGISDKARTIKNIYVGVGDTARKVIKAYVGDENGKARQWWPAIKKITRVVYSKLYGFNYRTFTPYRPTSPDIDAWGDQDYTMYYAGDFGTAIRHNPYACFNYVDISGSGDMGYRNPIKYTAEYESSGPVWYLDIPGVNGKWWLSIPTLLFGVTHVQFVIDGYNYLTNVWVGIAARRSDEGVQTPYEYVQGATVNSQKNVVVDFYADDLRADYIHIYADNVLGLKTQLRIRQIIATFERTYGIVTQTGLPVLRVPTELYLNFSKTGYQLWGGERVEFNVISATSAVWMLAFSSANNYTGDHIYADVDAGDYWGDSDGHRIFLFISKNPFTIKDSKTGDSYTSGSVTYGEKTTYYLAKVFDYNVLSQSIPLHSYAYTYYSNWISDNPSDIIGRIGFVVLHSGLPIK